MNQPAPAKFFPLSLPPFVSVSVCLSAPHSPFLSHLLKCLHSPIIFSLYVCECVCVCLLQTAWCSLAKQPPPLPLRGGILHHVSTVFRELSRKIKHRGPHSCPQHLPPHPPNTSLSFTSSSFLHSSFFPPCLQHDWLLNFSSFLFLSYQVTALILYAACDGEKSTVVANILIRGAREADYAKKRDRGGERKAFCLAKYTM